jgi:methyl coenzyme M reductase subunit D
MNKNYLDDRVTTLDEKNKNYLIEEICNKYLPNSMQSDLAKIFLNNKTIFGNNFYTKLENRYNDFEERIIYLVDELIDTDKLNDFLRIVRTKYPRFAEKINICN